jgi:collagen type VII alpha
MPQGIFTWVGQWLGSPFSTNVYYKNDVVKYNNIVYICVAAVSVPVGSQNPSLDTANWNVMVTGFSGSSGSSGSSGTSGSGSGSSLRVFGPTGEVTNSGATGLNFLGSGIQSVSASGEFVTITVSGGTGSGTPGTSGTSGLSGSSGTSGESGSSGTSGQTGSSGTSGTSGQNGTSGTSGDSGTSGTSGTSGSSGTSGQAQLYKSTSSENLALDQTLIGQTLAFVINSTPPPTYTTNQTLIVSAGLNTYLIGNVNSWNPSVNDLNIDVTFVQGSGTFSSWNLDLQGKTGITGASGTSGTSGINGSSGTSGQDGSPGAGGTIAYSGSFFDTTTQTNAGATAANLITINSTDFSNGVSIQNGSEITIANTGTYDIQFSIQFEKQSGGDDTVNLWLSKNGTNVQDSNTKITFAGNPGFAVAAWNFLVQATSGDYYELYWSSDDTTMTVHADNGGTDPARPDIPSVIISVAQVTYTQVGPTGATGASGTSGTSGTSGASGSSGTSGLSGTSGTSGSSGSSGTGGTSGTSGTSFSSPYVGNLEIQGQAWTAIDNNGSTTATTTIDFNTSNVQSYTLNASTTFSLTNMNAGATYIVIVKQAAGASYTATFTGVLWSGGSAPTQTPTNNKYDVYTFIYDGTNIFGSYIQNF